MTVVGARAQRLRSSRGRTPHATSRLTRDLPGASRSWLPYTRRRVRGRRGAPTSPPGSPARRTRVMSTISTVAWGTSSLRNRTVTAPSMTTITRTLVRP